MQPTLVEAGSDVTSDRATADEALASAIRQHADAYNLSNDDEMLSDYAVVAYWQRIEDDERSRYTMHYSRQTVPNHIAAGLFTVALETVGNTADDDQP